MSLIKTGGTVGMLGGGQLARMMAFEARRMGYRVAVLEADPEGPAMQMADIRVTGALDDREAAIALARQSDVLTLDTEHVPADLLEVLEPIAPVRPSARVLGIIQDRLRQREFLASVGAPQARHASVSRPEELREAAEAVGMPSVLKTRHSGYDGKGQIRVDHPDALEDAWNALERSPAILEAFIDFRLEISVLLARDAAGSVCFYPIAENTHRSHILYTTRVPARIPVSLGAEAEALGACIAQGLDCIGMLAIELFVTQDGKLLVNELAPRTHNSGHYSFGACATSQFEQHIRAICGLPLGNTRLLSPVVMLNLLGDLWSNGAPSWQPVYAHPSARLHLYGKKQARPGRKMGHVLVLDEDVERAAATVETIAAELAV